MIRDCGITWIFSLTFLLFVLASVLFSTDLRNYAHYENTPNQI